MSVGGQQDLPTGGHQRLPAHGHVATQRAEAEQRGILVRARHLAALRGCPYH
jgi:hypothetical protein